MTMHPEDRHSPNATLLGAALSIAPAAVGCAVGLLLSERMKPRTRHSIASTLFSLGALAALPLAIDYTLKTLHRPSSRRGSTRKLEGIRHSGINPDADIIGGEEYFIEQA